MIFIVGFNNLLQKMTNVKTSSLLLDIKLICSKQRKFNSWTITFERTLVQIVGKFERKVVYSTLFYIQKQD